MHLPPAAPAHSADRTRGRSRRARVFPGLALVVALGLAACSSDDNGAAPTSSAADTTAVVDSSTPDTTAPGTTAPDTTAPAAAWETITAPADCMCSDGSGFDYYVKRADPTRVVLYFEGGGACFDRGTCGPESDNFSRTLGDPPAQNATAGIFDDSDPRNPFRGWSVVYVPYCTGDVHLGNTTTDYGDGVVVQHKGYLNASAATAGTATAFPDATRVAVVGESAGGVAVPLYAGVIADLLPDASITAIADSSGAYPDIAGINAVIGAQWGTMNAVPDWPENAGMTVDRWSIPGLFVQAGRHAPRVVFGRHDYANDRVQSFFAGLAGIPADDLVSLIDRNTAQIRAAGIPVAVYVAPGSAHTVLSRPGFYTETVNDVAFVDWVTQLLTTGTADDVHCDAAAGACTA